MILLKEVLFWWLLIDAILVIVSREWRKERISYLKRLDKKRASI